MEDKGKTKQRRRLIRKLSRKTEEIEKVELDVEVADWQRRKRERGSKDSTLVKSTRFRTSYGYYMKNTGISKAPFGCLRTGRSEPRNLPR